MKKETEEKISNAFEEYWVSVIITSAIEAAPYFIAKRAFTKGFLKGQEEMLSRVKEIVK